MFAAILPSSPAVLYFEMFFYRRLHVIIAVAVELDRDTDTIEFPGCDDVIAAAAIVIGVFSVNCTVSLRLDGLRASRVTLNNNFVGVLLC